MRGLLAGRKNRAAFVYGFVDREEGGYLTDWWDLGTFHIVADTPSARTSTKSNGLTLSHGLGLTLPVRVLFMEAMQLRLQPLTRQGPL